MADSKDPYIEQFTFVCANCKTKAKCFGLMKMRFSEVEKVLITDGGWVKMNLSDVPPFYDYLCPKCK